MSIFMELRCEDSCEEHAEGGYVYQDGTPRMERCWSYDNSGCGVHAGDTQKSGLLGIKELFDDAKKCGWIRMPHGWICPYCAEQRKRKGGTSCAD